LVGWVGIGLGWFGVLVGLVECVGLVG
jgi:hypothetical protein